MNLNEQIYRIKTLMFENYGSYKIKTSGDVNVSPGIHIVVYNDVDGDMGHTNIINFKDSFDLDWYVKRFYDNSDEYCITNCDSEFFNPKNTVYLHDLEVYEPFRGRGLGKILKNECHKIAKNLGYEYTTSIVDCNNVESQGLNRKLGYETHQTDGYKDFLFKKIK